jgi:HEAT repeat protein
MEQSTKVRLKQLGKNLCKLSYNEIENQISSFDNESLIELMNNRSRRVADTAFGLLDRKEGSAPMIVEALLSGRFTHRDAKVRASNFLLNYGRACPEALTAYLYLLDDKNEEVVDQALFGIVFLQDSKQLETLKSKRDVLPISSELRKMFDKAIQAIAEKNPFLISPGFHDINDVWLLDKTRFGDRIGPLY